MLTFKELKEILDKKDVSPNSYDINPEGDVNCRNGYAIKKVANWYYLYQVIDGDKYVSIRSESERIICDLMHTEFFSGSNPYYWDDDKRRSKKEEYERDKERDRRFREELKEYAERFEAKQKQEGRSSNMTFEELKYILIKEDISPYSWCILGCARVSGYDGYVIKEAENGYDLYYMERGQYDFLEHADNEHKACLAFLNTLAESGDYSLIKYINFNELPESSLLTVKLPKYNPLGYDIQEAIKLSLKLGRKLTDEESKQFEIQK